MIILDYSARTPIFEQIKEQIVFLVQQGVLKPHDKLPSIRALASELGINVNTVKRSFAELEADDIVYTEAGRGIFISTNAVNNESVRKEALTAVENSINAAKSKGIEKQELIDLIESAFE